MKKICSILIVLILFNFIFSSLVFAGDNTITYSEESFNSLVDNGTVSIDGDTEEVTSSTSSTAATIGTQTSAVSAFFIVATSLLRMLANQGGLYYTNSTYSAANIGWFSVNSLVFGEYLLFNADITQTNKSLNPAAESTAISNIIDEIKEVVATIFEVVKLVSISIIVILLIITGIRYALADLAVDRAKYKEALKAWAIGLGFLILVPYIISLFNYILNRTMDYLWDLRVTLENSGYSSFESELFLNCLNGTAETGGLKFAAYFIELLAFIIMDFYYFFRYAKRLGYIFILIITSPIYALLHIYSKLKGGEGKLGEWFSKYTTNLFMQPLQAFLYLIFMFTASEIALNAPLLAVVFLWALSRAEKIFDAIFEFAKRRGSLFSK